MLEMMDKYDRELEVSDLFGYPDERLVSAMMQWQAQDSIISREDAEDALDWATEEARYDDEMDLDRLHANRGRIEACEILQKVMPFGIRDNAAIRVREIEVIKESTFELERECDELLNNVGYWRLDDARGPIGVSGPVGAMGVPGIGDPLNYLRSVVVAA